MSASFNSTKSKQRIKVQQGKKIGGGGFGIVYEAYPKNADDSINMDYPFAVKRHMGVKRYDVAQHQKEAKQQSQFFTSMVSVAPDRTAMTIMPMLPGQPILDSYDELHPRLKELTLSERFELIAVIAQASLEFHSTGSLHEDLKPENVLIAIEKIHGKASFQCNFIDSTGTGEYTIATIAPEFFENVNSEKTAEGKHARGVIANIYSLTSIIVPALGGNDVFEKKYKTKGEPYYTTAQAQFSFKKLRIHLKEEGTKFKTYLEEHKDDDEIVELFKEALCCCNKVYKVVTRMGSNEPKRRPTELKMIRVFNRAALVCREAEMIMVKAETTASLRTEVTEPSTKLVSRMAIPIRNHLLLEFGKQVHINVCQEIWEMFLEAGAETDVSAICEKIWQLLIETGKEADIKAVYHTIQKWCSIRTEEGEGAHIKTVCGKTRQLFMATFMINTVCKKIWQEANAINSKGGKSILNKLKPIYNVLVLSFTNDSNKLSCLAEIKGLASQVIEAEAAERRQSLFGFFYQDKTRLYQNIVNTIDDFEKAYKEKFMPSSALSKLSPHLG